MKLFLNKFEALFKTTIGDSAKDMFYVEGLATAPARQRRGYGGMLLDTITALVRLSLLIHEANILKQSTG